MMQWIFAATLICGASVFTACGSDDDNENNPPVQPDDDGGNSGTTSSITYIERSWDGEKVVDQEVKKTAGWMDAENFSNGVWKLQGIWYVTGNLNLEGADFRANGDLHIVLCDDAVLKLESIIVEGNSRLFIHGQKRGTGQLIVGDSESYSCAIGTYRNSGGTIEIHGGNITAQGGIFCAAIGEGCEDNDGDYVESYPFNAIKIYGGTINATGGSSAAAIGGSRRSTGKGNVYIYGGEIHAKGGDYLGAADSYGGAGIGGGSYGPIASVNIYGGSIYATGGSDAAGIGRGEGETYNGQGVINIYGGYVEAWGDEHGAAIGGGDEMYMQKITISGGDIQAHGGDNAAGIGGGEGAQGGNIEIKGGTVHTWAGADGAGIGGGEDGDGGTITISGGLVFAYGKTESNNGFGAGIGGGQDGNSGTITISGGEVHAYGGDDAAGIGTGEETTSGPNIKADNITISGGVVEAVGGGYGAGIGAGQDAEVGTITVTTENGPVHVSGRAGNDCGLWAGSIGAYKEDARGTLNIGKGVKVIGITDFNNGITWTDIPVELNPVAWIYERCHVQLKTCDHPGYTAQTCIFCKH